MEGITRRGLLVAGATSGAAIWLPWSMREADAASLARVPAARGGRFMDGVLSGDPEPTAVTLWTRLSDQELPRVRVRLEVATDEDFKQVVVDRQVPAARLHLVPHQAANVHDWLRERMRPCMEAHGVDVDERVVMHGYGSL